MDYSIKSKEEYGHKLTFDQDGDRKLNKVENARYVADKEGLDQDAAAFYVEHGCTFNSSDKSYDCPKGTPDWGSPEAQAEVKAKQEAEEAKQEAYLAKLKAFSDQRLQVYYDCRNRGGGFDYCHNVEDEWVKANRDEIAN